MYPQQFDHKTATSQAPTIVGSACEVLPVLEVLTRASVYVCGCACV